MANSSAGHAELTPAQLDVLEDALEGLEWLDDDALAEREPDDPAVAERLGEFRSLLVLSREAMPMQDVPDGLLDGVLAEARQAAAVPAAAAAQTSWWQRLRMGVWVPALAFAGSAALLLVWWPTADNAAAPAEDTVAPGPVAAADGSAVKEGEARLADASSSPRSRSDDPFSPGAARGGGVAPGAAPAKAEAPESQAELEPEEPIEEALAQYDGDGDGDGDGDDAEDSRTVARKANKKPASSGYGGGSKPAVGGLPSSGGKKAKGKKGGGFPPAPPAPKPAPAQEPADDEEKKSDKDIGETPWGSVLEADRQRHAGNCGLAKMGYNNARKDADTARTRARALAGLGLCAAQSGEAKLASKLFDQARAADPSVGSFIDAELGTLDGAPNSRPNTATESPAPVQQSKE